ncbi:unnamed protein product, partial [Closterium sp. NIES-64]
DFEDELQGATIVYDEREGGAAGGAGREEEDGEAARSATELKEQGNAAFSRGEYEEAVGLFTRAIQADPSSSVLFSNRSAAHAAMKNFQQALHDGRKALQLQPRWAKAYSRIAVAHYGMKQYVEAAAAYEKGLKCDPLSTMCRQGLQQARERWQQEDEKEAKSGKHTFRKRKTAEGGAKGEGKGEDALGGKNQKKASGGQMTTQKGVGSLLSFDEETETE